MQVIAGWVAMYLDRQALGVFQVRECEVFVLSGKHGQGLSVGHHIYLWLDPACPPLDAKSLKDLITHEYGHWEQAKRWGPLWLIVFGLPSLLWASLPFSRAFRQKKGKSYYWLYTEANADKLGGQALGHTIRRT